MARFRQRNENAARLMAMRESDEYARGALIDEAADLAMCVGRRPMRQGTFRAGSQAVAATTAVDYEALNAQYETQLVHGAASGWED